MKPSLRDVYNIAKIKYLVLRVLKAIVLLCILSLSFYNINVNIISLEPLI